MIITLKRMDGTHKELSSFKKGKRFSTLRDAETELWLMSQTAPLPSEGITHRVAYEVHEGGRHMYGQVAITRCEVTSSPLWLRDALREDYDFDILKVR